MSSRRPCDDRRGTEGRCDREASPGHPRGAGDPGTGACHPIAAGAGARARTVRRPGGAGRAGGSRALGARPFALDALGCCGGVDRGGRRRGRRRGTRGLQRCATPDRRAHPPLPGRATGRGARGAAREGAGGPGTQGRGAAGRRRVRGSFPPQRAAAGRTPDISPRRVMARGRASVVAVALVAVGCGGALDVGRDLPHGLLPVDERNPVILYQDDWSGDWLGEYAVLRANHGGPPLAGIVINMTPFWMDVDANASGWNNLLTAARGSGLKDLPEVTPSPGGPLTRPTDGQIDSTVWNDTAGAELMVKVSLKVRTPTRPVAIVATTAFTDLANAYFLDRTIVDRVVVVFAAGSYQAPNGIMNRPNGDMDPWADWIVTQRYHFVHVGTWYDQTADIPDARLHDLPNNSFGTWNRNRQPQIIDVTTAADQVALLSFALRDFTKSVVRAAPDTSAAFSSSQGPNIVPNENGNGWLVTEIAAPLASSWLRPELSGTPPPRRGGPGPASPRAGK